MSAQLGERAIRGRAYLREIRNVKQGLITRSKIIDVLSEKACTISQIAEELRMSEASIRRHLRNMLADGVVEKFKYKGKILWRLSGSGQLDLEEILA